MNSKQQNIINFIRKVLNPTFIIFIVIACALLYLSKLTHTYTTVISVPINIQNSIDDNVGVVGGSYKIDCKVEADGHTLLLRKRFPHEINIDISKLDIIPIQDTYYSEIMLPSLMTAMSSQMHDMKIVSIVTPRVEIVVSPLKTKKVAIINNIKVRCRNQYMQIGKIRLEPDSIYVKSASVILDTLKGIHTETEVFKNVSGNLSGQIALKPIDDVIMPVKEIGYQINVESYTEVEMTIPIDVVNAPEGYVSIVIPKEAIVKFNVSSSGYSGNALKEVKLYVDTEDKATNVDEHYKVYVACGKGLFVKEISPYYVKILFEPIEAQND